MLGKLVILLLFTESFGTHCMFSKYMWSLFETNEKHFDLKFPYGGTEKYELTDLMAYGANLQSHGRIIMVMLDELRIEQPGVFHADLMTVNLYLNNRYGNLDLRSLFTAAVDCVAPFSNLNAAIRIKYLEYYGMVRECLTRFLENSCQESSLSAVSDYEPHKTIKTLICDGNCVANVEELSSKIDELKTAARRYNNILPEELQNNDYKDFSPDNMLFATLLSGYEQLSRMGSEKIKWSTVTVTDPKENDGLNPMRMVKINKKYAKRDGYTIMDLYMCTEFNFKADLVKSFQQQVLAATIHPVLSCASRYFKTVEYVYAKCTRKLYNLRIKIFGNSVVESLEAITKFDIFPTKVNKYLERLAEKTKIFNGVKDEKNKNNYKKHTISTNPHSIKVLLDFCSKPMELNGLVFDAKANIVQSQKDCGDVMNRTSFQINELKRYIKALSKKLDAFHIIKRTVAHDEMFDEKPQNVLTYCADNVRSIKDSRFNMTKNTSQTDSSKVSANVLDPGDGYNTNEENAIHKNKSLDETGSGNEAESKITEEVKKMILIN